MKPCSQSESSIPPDHGISKSNLITGLESINVLDYLLLKKWSD